MQEGAYHPSLVFKRAVAHKVEVLVCMCVSFLNTLVFIDPYGEMTDQVSRKARALSTLSQDLQPGDVVSQRPQLHQYHLVDV